MAKTERLEEKLDRETGKYVSLEKKLTKIAIASGKQWMRVEDARRQLYEAQDDPNGRG